MPAFRCKLVAVAQIVPTDMPVVPPSCSPLFEKHDGSAMPSGRVGGHEARPAAADYDQVELRSRQTSPPKH
jgi:hypothetical protein